MTGARGHGGTGARGSTRAGILATLLLLLPAAGFAQLRLAGLGEGAYVQHRVNAGSGVELSSGTLFGGRVVVGVGRYVEVAAGVGTGSLTADSVTAGAADLARGDVTVIVLPVPWLAIRAGAEQHTFTSPVVVQRWTSVRIGGEGRLLFHGGTVAGVLRFEFYPSTTVSGLPRPSTAFGAATGLTFRSGIITARVLYQLERYDFPASGGVERAEQMSYLTGSVGLALGRR